MGNFKGIRKLSEKKYNQMLEAGTLDNDILYVTPQTGGTSEGCAKVNEENTFTAKQSFNAETQFEGIAEHNADIKVNNSVVKIIDSTLNKNDQAKDLVTQYRADEIVVEENSQTYNLAFPKKSGIFALDGDIPLQPKAINITSGEIVEQDFKGTVYLTATQMETLRNTGSITIGETTYADDRTTIFMTADTTQGDLEGTLKHSKFVNEDNEATGTKTDSWKTEDTDATIDIYHEEGTTHSGISISKAYTELGTVNFDADTKTQTSYTRIKTNGIDASIQVDDGEGGTQTLRVTSTEVTINEKKVSTEEDINKKLNKLPESSVNRVYIKTTEDTDKAFSVTPEGDTFAIRDSLGRTQVETPAADKDATNKSYVDTELAKKQNTLTAGSKINIDSNNVIKVIQNYIDVSGTEGTIDQAHMTMLAGDDTVLIRRAGGTLYRLQTKPANGEGEYTFICDVYTSGDASEWADYVIKVKQDGTWTHSIVSRNSDVQGDQPAVLYTEQTLTESQQNQVCTNLALEDKFLEKQTANAGELKAYCINGTNQDVCGISNNGTAKAIVRYGNEGRIICKVAPTNDDHVVNWGSIKDKLNHEQVYFGNTLPTSGIGTTYLENDVFILTQSNGTKVFYQLKYPAESSTLTWTKVVDFEKPKWQVLKPTDTNQILETEITITACTQYSGLVGGSVIVKGYADNGADNWNIAYFVDATPVIFLGKITKSVIQGLFLTEAEGISTAAVSIPEGEITFSYKYLW